MYNSKKDSIALKPSIKPSEQSLEIESKKSIDNLMRSLLQNKEVISQFGDLFFDYVTNLVKENVNKSADNADEKSEKKIINVDLKTNQENPFVDQGTSFTRPFISQASFNKNRINNSEKPNSQTSIQKSSSYPNQDQMKLNNFPNTPRASIPTPSSPQTNPINQQQKIPNSLNYPQRNAEQKPSFQTQPRNPFQNNQYPSNANPNNVYPPSSNMGMPIINNSYPQPNQLKTTSEQSTNSPAKNLNFSEQEEQYADQMADHIDSIINQTTIEESNTEDPKDVVVFSHDDHDEETDHQNESHGDDYPADNQDNYSPDFDFLEDDSGPDDNQALENENETEEGPNEADDGNNFFENEGGSFEEQVDNGNQGVSGGGDFGDGQDSSDGEGNGEGEGAGEGEGENELDEHNDDATTFQLKTKISNLFNLLKADKIDRK